VQVPRSVPFTIPQASKHPESKHVARDKRIWPSHDKETGSLVNDWVYLEMMTENFNCLIM